jgi:uncharacterized protein YecE (DUF72 family)
MTRKKTPSNLLPLFAEETSRSPVGQGDAKGRAITSAYVEKNKERLQRWASKGVLFGTSSWKYPGWKGMIYNRTYPSKKAFEQECLSEYSGLFPTVCADFALYDFPDADKMRIIHDQTADGFKVSLKVTDRITIRRYPNLPRHGPNAGKENPDFLNVELFEDVFLKPIEALKEKRGAIIFEFSTFHSNSGVDYGAYVSLIDDFLSRLPKEFEYAIELRNREFLTEEYLKVLKTHGVAHVLNSWTKMPPIIEQLQLAGVLSGKFSLARALLKPGRTYQEAVELFQPYDIIKEENPELRTGLADAVRRCVAEGKALYAYVNNRAEGNSPKTIEAILDILDQYPVEKL